MEPEMIVNAPHKVDYENYPREHHQYTPPASPPEEAYMSDNMKTAGNMKKRTLEGSSLRRFRTAFTTDQLCVMEEEFAKDHYISRYKRRALANLLRLPENTIKIWFQNRRMKEKRDKVLTPWPFGSMHPAGGQRLQAPYIPPYPSPFPPSRFGPTLFPTYPFPRWPTRPSLFLMSNPLIRGTQFNIPTPPPNVPCGQGAAPFVPNGGARPLTY